MGMFSNSPVVRKNLLTSTLWPQSSLMSPALMYTCKHVCLLLLRRKLLDYLYTTMRLEIFSPESYDITEMV